MGKFKVGNFLFPFEIPTLEVLCTRFKKEIPNFKITFPVPYPIICNQFKNGFNLVSTKCMNLEITGN